MPLDVSPWPGVQLLEPLTGGQRNEVWAGLLDGRRVVARRSRRSPDSLAWELDLLGSLAAHGVVVPEVVPAADGAPSVGGVVVQEWLDGRPPGTPDDWRLVAAELERIHTATAGTPQRPGCSVVTELGRRSTSVDADLARLPDDVATIVLDVFAEVAHAPVSLVHGDPGAPNIRIRHDGAVGLLDWDESRVDVTWHDLSDLGVQVLPDAEHALAQRLSNAWEAANAWVAEPEYARSRLSRLG